MRNLPFAKGHGTGNDFVLLPPDAGEVNEAQVRWLCDRRRGVGADGVICVVPTADSPEVEHLAQQAQWFMDYRNADGSKAQMCGNGARVFAHYLRHLGLVSGEEVVIATRAGTKTVRIVAGRAQGTVGACDYAVNLGQWQLLREQQALQLGMDALVSAPGLEEPLPALSVSMGNEHVVCMLPADVELAEIDLSQAPRLDPVPPNGANVEFVQMRGSLHVQMRVFERGVGETLSCGTGAAAAAVATWWWAGQPEQAINWQVDVPGGTLGGQMRGQEVFLAGPAVLVAEGVARMPADLL